MREIEKHLELYLAKADGQPYFVAHVKTTSHDGKSSSCLVLVVKNCFGFLKINKIF